MSLSILMQFMLRLVNRGLVAIILMAALVSAEERTAWIPISETRPLEEFLAVKAKLAAVTQCGFNETFLSDVVKYFSNRHKIEIRIDQETLQDEGINPDLPITFTIEGISLEAALNLALRPHELTFVNDGAGLLVTTVEKADRTFVTRAYPVDDLLAPAKSEASKTLATLLLNFTSGSWADDDDEDAGRLVVKSDSLNVRHNHRVHREVERILTGLSLAKRTQAMPVGTAPPIPPAAVPPPAHRHSEWIERNLQEQTECAFTDNPLNDVIRYLQDLHRVTIRVDQAALEDDGISLDKERVSLEASGLTLQSALKLILEPRGLAFINENEVLKITTRAVAEETFTMRVYPVRDLVRKGNEDDYKSLTNVIMQGTSCRWHLDCDHGAIAMCKAADSLVISQRQQIHREIDGILSALRRSQNLPLFSSIAVNFDDPDVLNPFVLPVPPLIGDGFEHPQTIEKVLRSPAECAFQNKELEIALRELQKKHFIPIVLDRPALGDEGIDGKRLVTLKSSGRTLDATLRLLLEPLGLTYVNEFEVLKITTDAVSRERDWTRIYPVGDLTAGKSDRLPDWIEKIYDGTEEKLLWLDRTDHGGSIVPFAPFNVLVVHHTQQAHREVERYLASERKDQRKPNVTSLPISRDAPAILNPSE